MSTGRPVRSATSLRARAMLNWASAITRQHGFSSFLVQVRQEFAGTSEARESSVLHTGAAGEGTTLHHQHPVSWVLAFMEERGEEADDPTTDHHEVGPRMELFRFPDAVHSVVPKVDRPGPRPKIS